MKPNNRMIVGPTFAVVCLTAIVVAPLAHAEMHANGAEMLTDALRGDPGDAPGARSELENLRDSERYEWLVHSSPNFRAVRDRKECGPTHDAPAQADCGTSLGR